MANEKSRSREEKIPEANVDLTSSDCGKSATARESAELLEYASGMEVTAIVARD